MNKLLSILRFKPHKSIQEIDHAKLDEKKDGDNTSARYKPLESIEMIPVQDSNGKATQVAYKIKDKIAYEPNLCPNCRSENSYHWRIQQDGDKIGNIWRHQQFQNQTGATITSMKFDFCLDCRKEFLMEMFILEKVT